MRVQTFVGKASVEALRQMDEHINHWLETNNVEPRFIKQCFGYGRHHDVSSDEPAVLVSVWY